MQNRNIIKIIKDIFHCKAESISDLQPIKKGMTNNSFVFTFNSKKYILRIPGDGTNKLINRLQEFNAYQQINSHGISDSIVYINPITGIKVAEYVENARNCNPYNPEEVKQCMTLLKKMHSLNLQVEHKFDLLQKINYYEKLRNAPSKYAEYVSVKQKIFKLLDFINSLNKQYCLTHIDPNHDNFIFDEGNSIKLIDWEYAGMQDPHVDIAMFAVYAMYTHAQIDDLIYYYFGSDINEELVMKIYAYVAIVGFMWSNWCEYKEQFGFSAEEYAKAQWQFGVDYSEIVLAYLDKRIETAIIMAAGKGVRLGQYTIDTPKPLINVHGRPMIECEIEALQKQGIKDINIVIGYKKEQFNYLKNKYNVTLIYNPDFDKSNNISSLYCAKHRLINKNTVILDGDLIFKDASVIQNTVLRSGYSAFWTEQTKEWALQLNDYSQILSCNRNGGSNCFELKSLSYWKRNDATTLAELVSQVYRTGQTNVYWDDVPMFIHFDRFELFGHNIESDDIIEIDTVEELQEIDKSYK